MAASPSVAPGVTTPQFRTMLLRRLKNMFPHLRAEIYPFPRGIAFQLFDGAGMPRGHKVNLHAHHSDSLDRANLRHLIGEVERG